jgi:ribosomal protein S18 acetylase RimI-like enzyme
MTVFLIRPYQATDRKAVMRIGADTAFFGAPIEAYMEDRNIFLDSFYAYYTDVEPEHGWVACADEKVIGFLMGCTDSSSHAGKYIHFILPRLLGNLIHGKYHFGKKTFKYMLGLLGGFFRNEFPSADHKTYPAHLHINVDETWRGNGLGKRLINAYLKQLRAMGVSGVYLETTSLNEAACMLYEKAGFHLLDARPDRFWARWFGHPVENRCYVIKLTDKAMPEGYRRSHPEPSNEPVHSETNVEFHPGGFPA